MSLCQIWNNHRRIPGTDRGQLQRREATTSGFGNPMPGTLFFPTQWRSEATKFIVGLDPIRLRGSPSKSGFNAGDNRPILSPNSINSSHTASLPPPIEEDEREEGRQKRELKLDARIQPPKRKGRVSSPPLTEPTVEKEWHSSGVFFANLRSGPPPPTPPPPRDGKRLH